MDSQNKDGYGKGTEVGEQTEGQKYFLLRSIKIGWIGSYWYPEVGEKNRSCYFYEDNEKKGNCEEEEHTVVKDANESVAAGWGFIFFEYFLILLLYILRFTFTRLFLILFFVFVLFLVLFLFLLFFLFAVEELKGRNEEEVENEEGKVEVHHGIDKGLINENTCYFESVSILGWKQAHLDEGQFSKTQAAEERSEEKNPADFPATAAGKGNWTCDADEEQDGFNRVEKRHDVGSVTDIWIAVVALGNSEQIVNDESGQGEGAEERKESHDGVRWAEIGVEEQILFESYGPEFGNVGQGSSG